MDLRRLAQTNNMSSPRRSNPSSRDSSAGPSSPAFPSTPKPRLSHPVQIVRSPLSTPSLSASVPFDWEAARSRRDPPYPSPASTKAKGRGRQSKVGPGLHGTPAKKRVVRKKSLYEKIRNIPSRIAFEISIFPANVPLPENKTSACAIASLLHLLHFYVRVYQVRTVPDSDMGWEDMYREDNGVAWFDWTVPMTFFLILVACGNALYLFSRTKLYHLHTQPEPVASPHARFVSAPTTPPSLPAQLRSLLWRGFTAFWRFLLGIGTSASSGGAVGEQRVQELEVWTPGELELLLFCLYSPVHALLWMCWNTGNWIIMLAVMAGVSAQLRITTQTYEALLKDRAIIAAEVMHEYDTKFVYPRINPIRTDACVQTHQGEIVNIWED